MKEKNRAKIAKVYVPDETTHAMTEEARAMTAKVYVMTKATPAMIEEAHTTTDKVHAGTEETQAIDEVSLMPAVAGYTFIYAGIQAGVNLYWF